MEVLSFGTMLWYGGTYLCVAEFIPEYRNNILSINYHQLPMCNSSIHILTLLTFVITQQWLVCLLIFVVIIPEKQVYKQFIMNCFLTFRSVNIWILSNKVRVKFPGSFLDECSRDVSLFFRNHHAGLPEISHTWTEATLELTGTIFHTRRDWFPNSFPAS
jgi:hypothetical protein